MLIALFKVTQNGGGWQLHEALGVSQCRGHFLGRTCLPSHFLQKRGKNPSWHSGKRRVEQASKCAGVRHMRGPALHFPTQIWGNWSVHCGDFKTAESTHVQTRYFSKRSTPGSVDFQVYWRLEQYFGGTRWRSMLEIVALEQLYSTLRNTQWQQR